MGRGGGPARLIMVRRGLLRLRGGGLSGTTRKGGVITAWFGGVGKTAWECATATEGVRRFGYGAGVRYQRSTTDWEGTEVRVLSRAEGTPA